MLPGVTLPQPSYKKNLLSVLFAISIFTLGIAVDRLVAVSGWLAGLDFWPDFDHSTFKAAVDEYCRRDRRFGGLSARAG